MILAYLIIAYAVIGAVLTCWHDALCLTERRYQEWMEENDISPFQVSTAQNKDRFRMLLLWPLFLMKIKVPHYYYSVSDSQGNSRMDGDTS